MAERVRFELTVPVKVQRFSRPSRSTTLAPLRGRRGIAFETPKASSPDGFPKRAVGPVKIGLEGVPAWRGAWSLTWPSGLHSPSGGRRTSGRSAPPPVRGAVTWGAFRCASLQRLRFTQRRCAWLSRAGMNREPNRASLNWLAGRRGYRALPAPAQVRRMRSGRRGFPGRG